MKEFLEFVIRYFPLTFLVICYNKVELKLWVNDLKHSQMPIRLKLRTLPTFMIPYIAHTLLCGIMQENMSYLHDIKCESTPLLLLNR